MLRNNGECLRGEGRGGGGRGGGEGGGGGGEGGGRVGRGEDREEGRGGEGEGREKGEGTVVYHASMWMRCYYTAYSGIYTAFVSFTCRYAIPPEHGPRLERLAKGEEYTCIVCTYSTNHMAYCLLHRPRCILHQTVDHPHCELLLKHSWSPCLATS